MSGSGGDHTRLILLNRLLSRSASKAPQEHEPPIHFAEELLGILRGRWRSNDAIEFFSGYDDDDVDSRAEVAMRLNSNFVRLKDFVDYRINGRSYVILLAEYVDNSLISMPVMDIKTYTGRRISGTATERGVYASHVIIRMPQEGGYDDGIYRCAVESVPGFLRNYIEVLLCRQLARHARAYDWVFDAPGKDGAQRLGMKSYRYRPRLELVSDIGRTVGGKSTLELSHVRLTKRSERQAPLEPTAIIHEDVIADVDLKVSVSQAPSQPTARREWVLSLIDAYAKRGFKHRLYFRSPTGKVTSGALHQSVAGAADILMSQRAEMTTATPAEKWVDAIQPEIRDGMIKLLERDDLWQRPKR